MPWLFEAGLLHLPASFWCRPTLDLEVVDYSLAGYTFVTRPAIMRESSPTFSNKKVTTFQKLISKYRSCLAIFVLFAVVTSVLSLLSTADSPTWLYIMTTFLNGLFAGSLMNYTLSHVLHLTSPHVHYIVSSLIAMSRGFAGSFGSAIGGGFFTRILKTSLEHGFAQHDLPSRPALIRTLLGSPATVMQLTGLERLVAMQSYEHAIRMLFLGGSLVALTATAFQAATGWTSEVDRKDDPERDA